MEIGRTCVVVSQAWKGYTYACSFDRKPQLDPVDKRELIDESIMQSYTEYLRRAKPHWLYAQYATPCCSLI